MQNKEYYNEYIQAFLKQNAKLNLISKNDEKFLWEKHIFDSLSIEKFFDKYKKGKTMLDIGTGGGFPALPVAYTYKGIRKKINAINEMKDELNLENVFPICERAEKLSQKFDLITSRAVAPLKVISGYALPLLKKDGYFVAFKSVKAQEEIDDAKSILKKFNAKVIDIIEYDLPLEENHTRNLIVIKQQQ